VYDNNVAAAPGPGLDPISNFNQFPSPDLQMQQQQQVQQQPISPGFDNNNNYNQNPISPEGALMEARDVHVGSMCRCPRYQEGYHETGVIQPPSKATGSYHKRYFIHPVEGCQCPQSPETESETNLDQMPDFGVEDKPIFTGILSYESPLSLNNSLHNWLAHDLFHRIGSPDVFVQINHRSERDNEILDDFQRNKLNGRHPMTIMGSPEENLNPGMALSKFCRMAEQHPSSHPNGENLLLFLEKDWILPDHRLKDQGGLESIFRSAVALSQRGVPYMRLEGGLNGVNVRAERTSSKYSGLGECWPCPVIGVHWGCTTAHQHRWTNLPLIIDCSWFLRYLEPFAIMSSQDPIMSCGRRDGYCDWEKAMQDGRIAWKNSQWVVASLDFRKMGGQLFVHKEVDK